MQDDQATAVFGFGGFGVRNEVRLERADVLYEKLKKRVFSALKRVSIPSLIKITVEHVDDPGFDFAFSRMLNEAVDEDIIGLDDRGAIQSILAQKISTIKFTKDKAQPSSISAVFAIPVTGNRDMMERLFRNHLCGDKIIDVMKSCGFMGATSSAKLLEAAFHPMDVACITVGTARHLGAKLAEAGVLEQESLDRLSRRVEANFRYWRPETTYPDSNSETVTRLLIGGYNFRGSRGQDNKCTFGHILAEIGASKEICEKFLAEISEALGPEIEIGLPAALHRACSTVALKTVTDELAAEAVNRGIVSGPDDIVRYDTMRHQVLDDKVLVEATYDGAELGPVSVPFEYVARDDRWFAWEIHGRANVVNDETTLLPAVAPA